MAAARRSGALAKNFRLFNYRDSGRLGQDRGSQSSVVALDEQRGPAHHAALPVVSKSQRGDARDYYCFSGGRFQPGAASAIGRRQSAFPRHRAEGRGAFPG